MQETFQRNQRIEAAPLNEEAILFDPTTSKFFLLNSTSSFIWDLLSGPSNLETLSSAMCEAFGNVSLPDARNDVQGALEQMLAMELIVRSDVA